MSRKCVVTGGSGFIGAYLTRRLVADGWQVTVIDNLLRAEARRLDSVSDDIDMQTLDVRDTSAVTKAIAGAEVVFHLAAVNGTENFYKRPELVLDVGLRGALAVVNACRDADVPDLVVASSAEVYQTPAVVPTDETIPLLLPDSLNPRYSYGGSKIVSELIAFNYAQDHFRKVQVFRPHNVYGPDMGFKHVLPQFAQRALALAAEGGSDFRIEGDGQQTRAFAYVDDVVDGIVKMYASGDHREVYHIGNDDEVSIEAVALEMCALAGIDNARVVAGEEAAGGTLRRCPDISKMRKLGYAPSVTLRDGLKRLFDWYADEANKPADTAGLL